MSTNPTLIFQTPSRRCPFRKHNGKPIVVEQVLGRHRTRTRGIQRMYAVRLADAHPGNGWIAFGDELVLAVAS